MAIPEQTKRRSMDAVSHRETQAHLRILQATRSPKAAVVRPSPTTFATVRQFSHDLKRRAMNAISHVETVAQVGWLRLTGGIAVYAARIREVDRDARREPQGKIGPRPYNRHQRTVGHFEKD